MSDVPQFSYSQTPTSALEAGEAVLQSFRADRQTYVQEHIRLAAAAMAAGMVVLWAIGNPHIWTGAVGGLAAIALRGFYIASDELKVRWDLTDRRLLGPQTRAIPLGDIDRIKVLGSAVQVITRGGDKHLLKFQAKRDETRDRILAAKEGIRS